jgi:hypothetical protein
MIEKFSIASDVEEAPLPTAKSIARERPEVPGISYTEEGIPFTTGGIELLKKDSSENYAHQREFLEQSVGEISSLQSGEDLRKFLGRVSDSVRTLIVNSGELDLEPKEYGYGDVKYIQPVAELHGADGTFEATVIPVNGVISIKSSPLQFNEKDRPVGGFQMYLPIKESDNRYLNQSLTLWELDDRGGFVKGVNLEKIEPENIDYFKSYLKDALESVLKNSSKIVEIRDEKKLDSLLEISGHSVESTSNTVNAENKSNEISPEFSDNLKLETLSDEEIKTLQYKSTKELERRGLFVDPSRKVEINNELNEEVSTGSSDSEKII